MKRILAVFLILLLLFPYAAADGMIFIEDRDMWYLQPEQDQVAAIHYENGMENLLLAVSPGSSFNGTRAVWIFPVPAAPGQITTDVMKGFPFLTGKNFEDTFSDAVGTAAAVEILYAAFPVSLVGGGGAILFGYFSGIGGATLSKAAEVQVYTRIEKMGVTTEVVSATDAGALKNFLVERGMEATYDDQGLLRDYIGKNYTFVITSIADVQKFREQEEQANADYNPIAGGRQRNQIGVFVRFPTDRIYYPLRPTAAYGSREVPVILYVTGYVTPGVYPEIRDGTEVTYYTQDYFHADSALVPFFNGRTEISPLKYTKIRITVPSDRFIADFWIDPSQPAGITSGESFMQVLPLATVLTYVLFSALASLVAGMLVFKRKRAGAGMLLIHGLWNCATFIGFAVATKKKFPQAEYGKRWPFVLAFYLVFAGLISVYALVLAPSLIVLVIPAWILGLLSPILSLLLLLALPMMAGGLYFGDITSLLFFAVTCIAVIVLAFCPIPLLLWLRRWLDPAVAEDARKE